VYIANDILIMINSKIIYHIILSIEKMLNSISSFLSIFISWGFNGDYNTHRDYNGQINEFINHAQRFNTGQAF
jgi:hypothetical protein